MSEFSRAELARLTESERSPFLPVMADAICRNVGGENGTFSRNPSATGGRPATPGTEVALLESYPEVRIIPNRQGPRIAVRSEGRILLLDVIELVTVHAQGNYVMLERQTCSHLLRESVSIMAEKLKPYGFIRIHRSVLINRSYVEEIRPLPTGEYRLRLKGGRTYTVTRSYRKNLRELAELWIGVDTFACQP
jgi:hypothetical protein